MTLKLLNTAPFSIEIKCETCASMFCGEHYVTGQAILSLYDDVAYTATFTLMGTNGFTRYVRIMDPMDCPLLMHFIDVLCKICLAFGANEIAAVVCDFVLGTATRKSLRMQRHLMTTIPP